MSEREFWWASVEGEDPQVVEIYDCSVTGRSAFVTGNDCDVSLDKVRLIERVRPPEQVEALSDAMWQLLDDMGVSGQSVCESAKALARVAYEPFRIGATGEEAPLDYPLSEAERVRGEVRDAFSHAWRKAGEMPALPWSLDPISPLIAIDTDAAN